MVRIGYFSSDGAEKERILAALGDEYPITFFDHPITKDSLGEAQAFDMLVVRPSSILGKPELDQLPNVRAIATRSTGFDHIDLTTCKNRGVLVQNVPWYGGASVAEHAFALLLALSKRICDGYEQVRERADFDPRRLRGFDLDGKTLGVVGTGAIGRHAAKIGKGFGMQVVVYDVQPDEVYAKGAGVTYVSLEELLETSDVVTLHVPSNEGTYHLINTDNISRCKVGSVLINTSRGAVVETQAIIKGLAEGRLRGAGLDVFEEEPAMQDELHMLARDHIDAEDFRVLFANHVLIDHPNVIVTPHSAYNTEEALGRILDTTVENISSYLEGEPTNKVT